MAVKKFYWLKLKEDFFRQKEIKKLRKIAGGDTYTIIYLKMQLLSLKNEGLIYYEGTEDSLEEQLSLEIDEDIENVKVTLAFLFNNGLLEEVNENEYLLTKSKECMGKESDSASRVRKYREKQNLKNSTQTKLLQCNAGVTTSNKNVTTEKEIEKEIELQLDKKESCCDSDFNILNYAEERNFILSPIQIQKIQEDISIYSPEEVKKALDIADDNGKHTYSYVKGILEKRRAGAEQKKSANAEWEKMKKAAENGQDPF